MCEILDDKPQERRREKPERGQRVQRELTGLTGGSGGVTGGDCSSRLTDGGDWADGGTGLHTGTIPSAPLKALSEVPARPAAHCRAEAHVENGVTHSVSHVVLL